VLFSLCLSDVLKWHITLWHLAKKLISEHKTINQEEVLIVAQNFIKPQNLNFWVGAVGYRVSQRQIVVEVSHL